MAMLRMAAVAAGKLSPRDKAIRDWMDSYRVRVKNYYPNAVFEIEFVLGCTVPEFVTYLENLMEPGMTWENKSQKWYVQSILQAPKFDMKSPDGFYSYFHYSNLRPAWKKPKGFRADPNIPSPIDRDGDGDGGPQDNGDLINGQAV